jgi:two-component system, LytTR family, response regulator
MTASHSRSSAIRAVIVDDERNVRENLRYLIQDNCTEIQIVGEGATVSEAVSEINRLKPELVFLDIEIREGSGFDVLEQLSEPKPEIIFTTAYSQYAVNAFRVEAADYLLKPIDTQDLVKAVNKVKLRLSQNSLEGRLNLLMNNLEELSVQPRVRRIGLPILGGMQYFQLSDIIRLQSQSNYTYFYLVGHKEVLVSKTLKDFEESLVSQGFFRVHQSHMVNIEHVVQYHKADGGYIILSDGSTVPLSKSHKEAFIQLLNRI